MNEDDALVMLRAHLIVKMGNNIENIRIKIGEQYVWGWSLYYQDKRPEQFLVGHGPVLINKETKELFETGSAYSEEYYVERYEYKIGVRDNYKVEVRMFDKSDAHLRNLISKAGVICPKDIKLPIILYSGSKSMCIEVSSKINQVGLKGIVLEDFEFT